MKIKRSLLARMARRTTRPQLPLKDCGSAKRLTKGFTTGFTSELGVPPFIRWHS